MRIFEQVDWKIQSVSRNKKKVMLVPYIDARDAAEELDSLDPSWSDTYTVLDSTTAVEAGKEYTVVNVQCALTVNGVTRVDVGEGDTYKAAYSDALKRAAVKFGVARYLYNMPRVWLDANPDDPYELTDEMIAQAHKRYQAYIATLKKEPKPEPRRPEPQAEPKPEPRRPLPQTEQKAEPTPSKHSAVMKQLERIGLAGDDVREQRLQFLEAVLGRQAKSSGDLTDNDIILITAAAQGVAEAIGEKPIDRQDWTAFWKFHSVLGTRYEGGIKAVREALRNDWLTFLGG